MRQAFLRKKIHRRSGGFFILFFKICFIFCNNSIFVNHLQYLVNKSGFYGISVVNSFDNINDGCQVFSNLLKNFCNCNCLQYLRELREDHSIVVIEDVDYKL